MIFPWEILIYWNGSCIYSLQNIPNGQNSTTIVSHMEHPNIQTKLGIDVNCKWFLRQQYSHEIC